MCTRSKTAQDHTDGIRFSSLPKTLQDAIVVTQKLGLQYLWVDSLCIIQDDPQDLTREIANMANIFKCAFVTISAASAPRVDRGFLEDRQTKHNRRINLPYRSATISNDSVFIEREQSTYDDAEDPINLRAWVWNLGS